MVRQKVLASKKKQERVAHAQSCGDKEKTLEGRQIYMGQVDRGSAGAPVPRCSAEKAPQVVEKPGLTC